MLNIKNLAKQTLSSVGIFISQNQKYDWELEKVIRVISGNTSSGGNMIDVGAHVGEVTDLFIKYSPNGEHHIFEPLPDHYKSLTAKYRNKSKISIHNIALSDKKGNVSFHANLTHPAYSGIRRREYPSEQDEISVISVPSDTLDNLLLHDYNVQSCALIKIDVEGAELGVLQGAKHIIKSMKPIIVFEHGLGASDYYNTTPNEIFELLEGLNMRISTMAHWLKNQSHQFSSAAFSEQFYQKKNYYFLAYPKD